MPDDDLNITSGTEEPEPTVEDVYPVSERVHEWLEERALMDAFGIAPCKNGCRFRCRCAQ
jgi:hypothetical protein